MGNVAVVDKDRVFDRVAEEAEAAAENEQNLGDEIMRAGGE